MGLRYNRKRRIMQGILWAINRAFADAVKDHWTHEQTLEWRNVNIYNVNDFKLLPVADRHYLLGFWDAFFACPEGLIWNTMLVFTYEVNGVRLALGTPEYRAIDPGEICNKWINTGAYCWKDDITKCFTAAREPGSVEDVLARHDTDQSSRKET
jgi:hypothetical protein